MAYPYEIISRLRPGSTDDGLVRNPMVFLSFRFPHDDQETVQPPSYLPAGHHCINGFGGVGVV
jgi:hypothetical protein